MGPEPIIKDEFEVKLVSVYVCRLLCPYSDFYHFDLKDLGLN